MKVKFMPQNIELEIKPNQSVMELAHDNNIHIQSVCKGVPSCAECRIQIIEGEHNVFPPTNKELNLIGTAYFVDRSRLSCQLKCFGDLEVDLSQQIDKETNAKRPRGKFTKDPNKSSAVMGSILLDDPAANVTKPAKASKEPRGSKDTSQEDYNLRKAEKVFMEEQLRMELERIKKKKEALATGDKGPSDEDE